MREEELKKDEMPENEGVNPTGLEIEGNDKDKPDGNKGNGDGDKGEEGDGKPIFGGGGTTIP